MMESIEQSHERHGEASARVSFGVPRWAWIPVVVALADLLIAAFGYYWDVAWHIEKGRDEFIFTAPHTLIIIGLLGVGASGLLAHALFTRSETSRGVRILGRRSAPGAALLLVCGTFATLGFPLDDVWHHFFGQDVTAWGPTHLLMISGAALSPLALAMLLSHGRRGATEAPPRSFRFLGMLVASAMLVGLSAYQVEFDFGVPQFQLLYHPVLVAIASSLVLVVARLTIGPYGAIGAVAGYIGIRALIDVGLILVDRGTARFPAYVAAALVVELAARMMTHRRPLFSVVAGIGVGTIGLLGEAAFLQWWNPHPWTGRVIITGVLLGSVGAVAAATLGRAIAYWLRPDMPPAPYKPVVAAVVGLIAVLAIPLPRSVGENVRAFIRLTPPDAASAADVDDVRRVRVAVELQPEDAAEGTDWFEAMAWQGGGQHIAPLESRGGAFVSETRVPIGGEWKTLLRLAKGSQIVATPLYLPPDREVGAAGYRSRPTSEATLRLDSRLLLREARGGPAWALLAGYGIVLTVAVIWIALIFWGLVRLGRISEGPVRAPAHPIRRLHPSG